VTVRVEPTPLAGVFVVEPKVFRDERGFFMESWNRRTFADAVGSDVDFVQDNQSRSVAGVLRGIHYQVVHPQGKLVRVVAGRIFDVAVDLRRSSPAFGQWFGAELSDENRRQLWIPEGFGHAFVVLSEVADVLYKATEYWMPEHDRSLRWDDPQVSIRWPLASAPVLSPKDAQAPRLADADVFP
jgi:dTDP-4-dehydrorhamnose 3,5-epimerase